MSTRTQSERGQVGDEHECSQGESYFGNEFGVEKRMTQMADPGLKHTVDKATGEAGDRAGQMNGTQVDLLKVGHHRQAQTRDDADHERQVVYAQDLRAFGRQMISKVLLDLLVSDVDGEHEEERR